MATGTLPPHSFYTYSHLVRPLPLGNRWYIVPCLPICIIVQIRIILMSGLWPLGIGTPSSHYTYLFIHTIHIHILLLSGPLILGNRYPVPHSYYTMSYYTSARPPTWGNRYPAPHSYYTYPYYTSVKFLSCIFILYFCQPLTCGNSYHISLFLLYS